MKVAFYNRTGIATIKENAILSPISEHVFNEILNYLEVLKDYKVEKESLIALAYRS